MSIMKNFNFKVLMALAVVVLIFNGCASIKTMKKKANLLEITPTPNPLEVHAGQVQVAIEGKIPEKYFAKKATIVATPVLKYETGEKAYPEVKLQGEKVKLNNAVIPYKPGGNFSIKGALPYEAAMKMSQLQIRIVASKGLASLDFDPIIIGQGVIATSELVNKAGEPIIGIVKEKNNTGKYNPAIDKFQRVVPDEMMAELKYMINSSFVRKEAVSAEEVQKFTQYAIDAKQNDRKELKALEVSAYASPDGKQDFNDKLAKQRESSSTQFISEELKKAGVEVAPKTKYTAEDWDGFKKLMESSNIQDKELILRVLSMYSDPEVREQEIRNLAQAFTAVADKILPELRRAKFSASVDLIGKTDEEILEAAANKPETLNQAELIHAMTLTDDNNKLLQFSNSFTKQFSDDWRGYNNLGMAYVKLGDFEKAAPNFEKADKLNPGNPIIQNNLGLTALYNGETNKARELFSAASGLGQAVENNLGIVSIIRAEYSKAVQQFGTSNSPNAALAKILAGDNNGALKTLEAIDASCPMANYLKAVVGARTAKDNLVMESLKAAVEKKPELKVAAKTDLEFAKYFEDPKFKEIVQ